MSEQIKHLQEQIEKAQKIVVGIGEEWIDEGFTYSKIYQCYQEKYADRDEFGWILPFLKAYYLMTEEPDDKLHKAYKTLAKLLEGKDYFIVTLQNDGRIYQYGLKEERIVSPCGSYGLLQCEDNCSNVVEDGKAYIKDLAKRVFDCSLDVEELSKPKCNHCGQGMMLNLYPGERYCETGYLEQWKRYQMWLGTTMNRQSLFLEAGAGFSNPGIIRWPFEKAVFINQKAFLIRIHEELWQLLDEIGQKGCSVKMNSVEFLAENSF